MTEEQFAAIIERLDKIVACLEFQTFGPPEQPPCPHERAIDIGVMGMRPGERLKCQDCGAEFTRE